METFQLINMTLPKGQKLPPSIIKEVYKYSNPIEFIPTNGTYLVYGIAYHGAPHLYHVKCFLCADDSIYIKTNTQFYKDIKKVAYVEETIDESVAKITKISSFNPAFKKLLNSVIVITEEQIDYFYRCSMALIDLPPRDIPIEEVREIFNYSPIRCCDGYITYYYKLPNLKYNSPNSCEDYFQDEEQDLLVFVDFNSRGNELRIMAKEKLSYDELIKVVPELAAQITEEYNNMISDFW